MSKRINRPEDRLAARYVAFRRRRPATPRAALAPNREVDLPWACPCCGDRSVVETECDRCSAAMVRDPG